MHNCFVKFQPVVQWCPKHALSSLMG